MIQDIAQEKRHIDETIRRLSKTLSKKRMAENDVMAISVMLHNVYMGIENILRRILELHEIQINKTGTWHKDLLGKALEKGVITEELWRTLYKYLQFRHLQMHGYGYMLKWENMKPLALNAKNTLDQFFMNLDEQGYWERISSD